MQHGPPTSDLDVSGEGEASGGEGVDLRALTGRVSGQQLDELLEAAVVDLEQRLTAETGTQQVIMDLLARRMAGPRDAATWQAVRDGLSYGVDENVAIIFTWLAGDLSSRLRMFLDRARPNGAQLLRMAFGLYGPDLEAAYSQWNEDPDDWTQITHEVLFNINDSQYRFKIRLRKFNGEQLVFETRPTGFLQLVTILCETLRRVDGPSAFGADWLERFREELKNLDAFVNAPPAPDQDIANGS